MSKTSDSADQIERLVDVEFPMMVEEDRREIARNRAKINELVDKVNEIEETLVLFFKGIKLRQMNEPESG